MWRFISIIPFLFNSSYTLATELNDLGEPAIIELIAPNATVRHADDGKTFLTLHNIDKLTTIAAGLHKPNQRFFDAFPLSELAPAWNSCNAMKEIYHVWHPDGVNSLFIFQSSPFVHSTDHSPQASIAFRTPHPRHDQPGTAKLMLTHANYQSIQWLHSTTAQLTFEVQGNSLKTGPYQQVRVMTECVLPLLLAAGLLGNAAAAGGAL